MKPRNNKETEQNGEETGQVGRERGPTGTISRCEILQRVQ